MDKEKDAANRCSKRRILCVNLKSQEASLTGESVPVEKMSKEISEKEVGIGDRTNMLFSSSLITYGRGRAIVVETGYIYL